MPKDLKKLHSYHRFLDESGDTTFYGKRKKIIVGTEGVSKSFILGMVKFKSDLDPIRNKIIEMQNEIVADEYFKEIPSMNSNLNLALLKAQERFKKTNPGKQVITKIVFNVTEQTDEPLLNIADYFCWSVQNVFEKGNLRYYNFLKSQISTVIDLYDFQSYGKTGWPNYYGKNNPLTVKNKLSPLSH